jgi:hypothetical protein
MDAVQERSAEIGKLVEALIKARKAFPKIAKSHQATIPTKGGGGFSYKYADLADVLEAITPALSDNGLVLMQTGRVDGCSQMVTTLAHVSGQWISGALPLAGVDDARALGSWLTYLRRYGACGIVGVAAEDDDDGAAAKPAARGASTGDLPFKGLREEVASMAAELGQHTGKDVDEIVKAYSGFPGKDKSGKSTGKDVFFVDPMDPSLKSEKWLRGVSDKLRKALLEHEPPSTGADKDDIADSIPF